MPDIHELQKKVDRLGEIQPWNHNFTLPGGVETNPGVQKSHGKNLIKIERLRPLLKKIGMVGKSGLDVGCNEGFFSHFMADNGMQVQGIDIDEHRITKARFVKDVLGVDDVSFDVVDIYS